MKSYYVYIMTNKPYGTLYIGVTSDLVKRVYEHKQNVVEEFTSKYHLHQLVYFEETSEMTVALQREQNLKHWMRDWKIKLISDFNPAWSDLSLEWMDSRVEPENDKKKEPENGRIAA